MPYVLKGLCVYKKGASKPIKCHKTKADAVKHMQALNINVSSSVADLQEAKPQLTTVAEIPILKTGIEYPLSSGPTTFTPDDLAAAVAAQDDPSIPQPRIWIGHPDDTRIHGERSSGVPSGEPAMGKVVDMRLTQDGHCIVGDLAGIPVWLANIMSSASPSRSIEGRFNVKTPTGKQHRLVIHGLALLGVTWPGVMTIEDIASLYSEKGPKVAVTEATEDKPIEMTAMLERQIEAQVNVEDVRRQWYDTNRGDPAKMNWWLRAIFIEPNELIVDADDGGTLFKQPFRIKGEDVKFGKPKKTKIKYVNASHGGVEAEPIHSDGVRIAQWNEPDASVPSEQVLTVNLTGNYIEVKLGGSR